MRCSSCEPRLDRYVEATLAPRQMAAVASHLRTCDRCSSLLTELRVVDALLATTQPIELAPNFTFAVMAEARSVRVHEPRRLSLWAVLSFYLVAAWLALSAAYVFFGSHVPRVANAVGAVSGMVVDTFGTIAAVLHGLGPAAPVTVGIVSAVLFVDVLLACGLIYFYRAVRPRMATALARSEVR